MVFKRRWLKIGSGVGGSIVSILLFFTALTTLYGFQITDLTGDISCEGTYDNPCISEFMVKNPNPYVVDIYSKDQVKLDFSPQIKDYALFVPDGRCSATGKCRCDLQDGSKIGFKGWRCVDFTNKTKPRQDKVYNFRFRAYYDQRFRLAGIKNNPEDIIKWGFGVDKTAINAYLDPTWFGIKNNIKPQLKDKTLIDSLRITDTFRKKSNIDTYKSYDSKEKKLLIEDKDFKPLVELKLTSPYTTYVGSSDSTKVAEFLLVDYKEGVDIFDGINFYDKNNDYDAQERVYTLKYGVDYVEEECQLLPDLEKEVEYCQDVTKTNWIEFSSVSELPNRNIKIGLFTNTTLGDKVEWIPNIRGFDILEWADWDVTSGTNFVYDTGWGSFSTLTQIDSTHYLNVYQGESDYNGYAVVLTVNTNDWSITNEAKHKIVASSSVGDFSLVQINSTHYLTTYKNSGGYAVVLTVNDTDWTISNGTHYKFDEVNGYNNLAKIDSTHFLSVYFYDSAASYAVVLTVDGTTVSKETRYKFISDGVYAYNNVRQINSTHYLFTYQGDGNDGYAVVFIVNNTDWTITSGIAHEFDDVNAHYNNLVQIDSTHYLNAYMGADSDGYAVVLTVDGTTVSSGTKHEFDELYGGFNSLAEIDSTHYLNAYTGDSTDGYAVVLTVDDTDWTITSETSHEFDEVNALYNSLAQIDSSHYINSYKHNSDGYAVVLMVEEPFGVTIDYPIATTYSGYISVLNYTVTAGDYEPDSCWYSTDDGATNSSAEVAGTNFTGVTSVAGSNTWIVYCNDTNSDIASDSVTFTYTIPTFVVLTNEPADNSYAYDHTPDFNVTVTGNQATYSCDLRINGTNYGQNASVLNSTKTEFTANASLTVAGYTFNFTCVSGIVSNNSVNRAFEIREYTLSGTLKYSNLSLVNGTATTNFVTIINQSDNSSLGDTSVDENGAWSYDVPIGVYGIIGRTDTVVDGGGYNPHINVSEINGWFT